MRAALLGALCTLAAALGCGAATANAAGDLVASSTMTSLLGSTFPATDIRQGLYSPDHSHILYFGPQVVSNGGQLHPSLGDFYVMRADGTQRTRLTNYTTVLNTTVKLTSGMWAPDGTAVSFIHNAGNQIAIDAAVIKTAKLATTGGQDTWTVSSLGEGVYAAGYTPDARYLVWEEHISDVFTIDVFAVDRVTGAWYRLRWKPESPAGSPWSWAGECDLAAVATAPLPTIAQRLPSAGSDPLLDALAALTGPAPACFRTVTTPTPTPTSPTPTATPTSTSPTPTPTATPTPGYPTPTGTPTPTPTPASGTPTSTPGTPTPTPTSAPTATPTPAPSGSTSPTPAPTGSGSAPSTPTPTPAGGLAPTPTQGPVKAPVFPVPPSTSQVVSPGTSGSMVPVGSAAAASTIAPAEEAAGPGLAIGAIGKRLAAAKRKSLNVRFKSDGATGVKAWLVLASGSTLPTLASTAATPSDTGEGLIRFVLDGKAKRALRGMSRATVLVRLAAVDADGNRTVAERRVTLR